ncbi:MAG TPA: glycosyltransferase family 2 protein [Pirellulales bacterium]
MTTLFEILLTTMAASVLVPTTTLWLEVLCAAVKRSDPMGVAPGRPPIAVLIPAYNEAATITETLQSIMRQLTGADRILVVADNCSDDTAEIASAAGAEVITRTVPALRGKGYALDLGVRHLRERPPPIIVIIDSDCQVSPGSIDQLARRCAAAARPVQALYLMRAPQGAGLKMRIAEFAWIVKNRVRPLGLSALNLPCQLMGTGMAFPWECIGSANLATGHLVEDLKLGVELARTGRPPLFCEQALVTSYYPASEEGIHGQRRRWEHGHLGMIAKEAPLLLLKALRSLDIGLLAMSLDLAVPPLSLLSLLVTVTWLAAAVFAALTGLTFPLEIAILAIVLLVLSVMISWVRYGRGTLSLRDLASAPVYALWKLPLYVSFIVSRQLEWVRSKRD